MVLVAPSILSADFAKLGEECRAIIHDCGADWLHIDVMDGHFVPNLTLGLPVIQSLRKALPTAFFDCHLMIENPELWADRMISCGASSITFHFEATADAEAFAHTLHKAFQTRNLGSGHVGVSIKPDTPVSALSDELLEAIDMVLIMTVEPGFGGQALLPHCIEKVRELRKDRAFAKKIQVDGGIDPENVQCLIDAGADAIVAGSSIFKSTSLADRAAAIKALRGQ